MQIKINEKVHVVFHMNDKVFTRCERVPEDEMEAMEEWSRCNCCGAQENFRKLKNCHFCGDLFCPRCLFKQRPFLPVADSAQEASEQQALGGEARMSLVRGEICQICNRKFLYRDAMYELMGKLQANVRLPLVDMDDATLEKLKVVLKKYKVI